MERFLLLLQTFPIPILLSALLNAVRTNVSCALIDSPSSTVEYECLVTPSSPKESPIHSCCGRSNSLPLLGMRISARDRQSMICCSRTTMS
mmetsp:Transcript_51393/g.55633  ORF Transcript_51393/g.55633 Transcript_51393/m.55633 type:complete len:91 (+) Transcript_51393:103-375(+)